jgi:cytoskeletal protein CcmA (bactofilin family)
MDGILSGFRFSSKKTTADPKHDSAADASQVAAKTEANQRQGVVTQDSTVNPTQDRSPNMRLSKSNPSKPDEEFEIPSEPVMPPTFNSTPSSISSRAAPTAPAIATSTATAVIGPKITFKGEIIGEEDLLVQGKVEGSIDLKGNHLIIGQQGVVKANLMAKTITIEGTVEGDLIGQERIEIKSSSNVKGNLIAARVTLEDGAKFRGSIDMDSQNSGGTSKYSYSTTSEKTD